MGTRNGYPSNKVKQSRDVQKLRCKEYINHGLQIEVRAGVFVFEFLPRSGTFDGVAGRSIPVE